MSRAAGGIQHLRTENGHHRGPARRSWCVLCHGFAGTAAIFTQQLAEPLAAAAFPVLVGRCRSHRLLRPRLSEGNVNQRGLSTTRPPSACGWRTGNGTANVRPEAPQAALSAMRGGMKADESGRVQAQQSAAAGDFRICPRCRWPIPTRKISPGGRRRPVVQMNMTAAVQQKCPNHELGSRSSCTRTPASSSACCTLAVVPPGVLEAMLANPAGLHHSANSASSAGTQPTASPIRLDLRAFVAARSRGPLGKPVTAGLTWGARHQLHTDLAYGWRQDCKQDLM
uniref:DUF676 domain-containing protein n=1 Tax=Macrostomum lignano TaxID=282301 RepID=A0A1I8FJN4_9PLAT